MYFADNIDWFPIKLSFVVATAATLIALVAGSALAWLLARKRFPGRNLIDSLITLPLVLPPTVLGYYLLVLLGTRSSFGGFLYNRLGIRLTFTVGAAIIAATIHALPLVTKSLRAAFEGVDTELEAAARTLGLGGRMIFFRVTLPLASRGVLAATALAFARALGDFGVTIMIAGNIPGRTQTASVAIYDAIQAGRDNEAFTLAVIVSLIAVVMLYFINRFGRLGW
ncbi:MAG TPA: molybdate ABC transporter permease subunit [Pyrinomonadaceae bacterium]|nr:molybdate ABC transporter permease subunit [Pyrinomonadaceae bacterium]